MPSERRLALTETLVERAWPMPSLRAYDLVRYNHLYRRVEPYGEAVCTYCGDPCDSDDHLLPLSYLYNVGSALDAVMPQIKPLLLIVPACRSCNSIAQGIACTSIDDKRRQIHKRLRKKHEKLLGSYDWQLEDLTEIGRGLHDMIMSREHKRAWLLERLAWPGTARQTDFRAEQALPQPEEVAAARQPQLKRIVLAPPDPPEYRPRRRKVDLIKGLAPGQVWVPTKMPPSWKLTHREVVSVGEVLIVYKTKGGSQRRVEHRKWAIWQKVHAAVLSTVAEER